MRFVLGDDQPKDNPWQDDKLGYAPFAHLIFDVVSRHEAPNGYVLGLEGRWGSGKSTILNFVKAYLKKHAEEEPEKALGLIEFQPWMISGHQDLVAAFFKLLSEALGGRERGTGLRNFLRKHKSAPDPLVDAVAKVALLVDPTGTTSAVAGGALKVPMRALVDRFVGEESLQKAYERLRQKLKESGRRFIVTIDDIDRLEDDEIRSIVQMVKTVGRLPNVVYLLSYDREILGRVLDKHPISSDQPRFFEKIVQHEIAVPPPSLNRLMRMLDSEIAFLISQIPEDDRWGRVARDGIKRWIQKPRDVLRISNAVKWAWPALDGNFDPSDLLVMEGMRLFEPIAYSWVRTNRDFLFRLDAFVFDDEDVILANINALKDSLHPDSVEPTLRLLSVLFPSRAKWFEGNLVTYHEDEREASNRRGVASRAHYDSYFSLDLSDEAIPSQTLAVILTSSDVEVVKATILPYIGATTSGGRASIDLLLQELRFRVDDKKESVPDPAFLEALMSLGDAISLMPQTDAFLGSPANALLNLVTATLVRWGPGSASDLLIRTFGEFPPVSFGASLYLYLGRSAGLIQPSRSINLEVVSEETFRQMGLVLLSRIRAARDDGSLIDLPMLRDVLMVWRYVAGIPVPQRWLRERLTSNATDAAKVIAALVRDPDGRKNYRVVSDFDQELFELPLLEAAADNFIDSPELDEDARAKLQAMQRFVERAAPADTREADDRERGNTSGAE